MDHTGPDALEAALRAAIARHRTQLHREAERWTQAFEQRFLLACLGLSQADLDSVASARSAASLPPDLSRRVGARLVAEADRLLRLVRAGSARYDLNRHIAVHRALDWLRGKPGAQDETPSDHCQTGRAMNARFRRSGRCGRRAPRPAGGQGLALPPGAP